MELKTYRRLKKIFIALFGLGLVWAFGFASFVTKIRTLQPHIEQADGLVILTGGQGRIDEGFRLLAEGKAKRLLISGVTQDLDLETVMADIGQDETLKNCCVDAESNSTNTASNALEAVAWAKERGFQSLIVVTSDFHMPRALLIFRDTADEIDVYPHPVPSEVSAIGLAMEYNKYLLNLARTGFSS